jgi:hypothetical protein
VQAATAGLALARELGLTELSGWLLGGLGWLALQQEDVGSAERHLAEALGLMHGSWQHDAILFCLSGMAGVAVATGQFEHAATLWGKVNALRDRPVWAPVAPDIERLSSEIQAHLSEAEFTTAWSKGQAMGDEQAIAYALKTDDTVCHPSSSKPHV